MFLLDHFCSANDVLGIVGADVPVSVIYNFLTTEFDPCKNPNVEYVELFMLSKMSLVKIYNFEIYRFDVTGCLAR